ncbi:MAG TPA: hypothetical protein VGD66_06050 [Allosphingosinicella sp.]|jgi:hypothetical protein
MVDSDPFESPKLLVSGAREDIDQFESGEGAFFGPGDVGVTVQEVDPKTKYTFVKFRITKAIPTVLRRRANNILNDLRHALDQALFAAARIVLKEDPGDVHFPFATSPKDLEGRLKATRKGAGVLKIPVALHDVIRSFEPYPRGNGHDGGDDLLRLLGAVSGPNKHQFTIGIGVNASLIRHIKTDGRFYKLHAPVMNSKYKDLILFSIAPDGYLYHESSIPMYISFREAGNVTDFAMLETLQLWAGIVERIVNGLEDFATHSKLPLGT